MGFIRTIIAIFMAIFLPISNYIGSLTKEVTELNFTEFEKTEKPKRDEGTFVMGENDIIVEGDSVRDIEEAKESLKKLRERGIDDAVTVWIRGGEYTFDKALVFDESDADNVTYRAYPGEKVVFSGALALSDWKEEQVNGITAWSTSVPDGISFDCAVKDGTTLPKTRYPEKGYLTIEKEDHSDAMFTDETTPWFLGYGDRAFVGNKAYNPDSIKNVENVCVRVLHYWVSDINYLSSYDAKNNKYYTKHPFCMIVKEGDRYFFENIFEQLNAPGEWYLDSESDKLYYVPCEGDTMENTVVNACVNDKILSISDMKNVEFRGITFQNTNYTYPTQLDEGFLSQYGIRFPQAEYDFDGAVSVTKSNAVNFTNCDFLNIGNTAVKYNKQVKDSVVTGCTFKNIGVSGVFIHGYNTDEEEKITENIKVTDNKIESYGRIGYSAIGVFLTNARNCEISNNEISDGYYTAISVGWVWGYSYSVTGGNKIKDNLIYNIGQGWLSDMGGIYTLGIQEGTVLSGNVIHDVAADEGEGGYGGWGIYLDEGSSHIVVEKNLVYSCGSQSFNMHYGKENIVRNNIFALSKNGQVRSSFKEEHIQFRLKGNIILSDNSLSYARSNKKDIYKDDGNLYWDLTNGKYVVSSMSEGKAPDDLMYKPSVKIMGYYVNGVFEDPLFRDPRNFDFLIADGSEAVEKIGFETWDYTKAGTKTDLANVE